jgi:hypothetical protein
VEVAVLKVEGGSLKSKLIAFVAAAAIFLLGLQPALAGKSGAGGGGGSSASQLTTGDAFSDWLVSGCIATAPGAAQYHTLTDFAGTNGITLTPDEQYLILNTWDATYSHAVCKKVRISDWTTVATQEFSSTEITGGVTALVSSDGLYVYMITGHGLSGSDVTAWKMNASNLSVVTSATLTGVKAFYDYSTGNMCFNGNGSKIFANVEIDAGGNHQAVATIDAATLTFTLQQLATDDYTNAGFGTAAGDNTHFWSVNALNGTVDKINSADGTAVTLVTLDNWNVGNSSASMAVLGTKAIVGGTRVASSDQSIWVVNLAGAGSDLARIDTTGEQLSDEFNMAIAGTHGYVFDENTSANPFHLYQVPLDGTSSFTKTWSIVRSQTTDFEGVAVPADESHIYLGVDSDPGGILVDQPNASPTLTLTIPTGVAYSGGNRVTPSAVAHPFTALKDTYVSVNSSGAYLYNAVANGDPQPTITGLLLEKVVTDASGVTGITSLATTTPTLNAAVVGVMTTDTNQTVTGIKTFPSTKLQLRNTGNTASIRLDAATQTGTCTLSLPDLGGTDDVAMTLSTGQIVRGLKTFAAQTIYLSSAADGTGNKVYLSSAAQTANGDICLVPDLSGLGTDTLMTLRTTQYLSGQKVFAATGILISEAAVPTPSDDAIQLVLEPQVGSAALHIKDFGGVSRYLWADSDGGQINTSTPLTIQSAGRNYTVTGTITIDLPTASAPLDGLTFSFVNVGTDPVTFDVTGGGNISGAATVTSSTQWEALTFKVINGAWYVLSRSVRGS